MPPSEVYVERRPIRVRCRDGGPVPCFDDLCHGVDTTMCGLAELSGAWKPPAALAGAPAEEGRHA